MRNTLAHMMAIADVSVDFPKKTLDIVTLSKALLQIPRKINYFIDSVFFIFILCFGKAFFPPQNTTKPLHQPQLANRFDTCDYPLGRERFLAQRLDTSAEVHSPEWSILVVRNRLELESSEVWRSRPETVGVVRN